MRAPITAPSTFWATSRFARCTAIDSRGRFIFESVGPGDYVIEATQQDAGAGLQRGQLAIAVANTDMDDLIVVARPSSRLTGRIEFEGETAPSLRRASRPASSTEIQISALIRARRHTGTQPTKDANIGGDSRFTLAHLKR